MRKYVLGMDKNRVMDFAAILRRFCAKSTQFNSNLAEIELILT